MENRRKNERRVGDRRTHYEGPWEGWGGFDRRKGDRRQGDRRKLSMANGENLPDCRNEV